MNKILNMIKKVLWILSYRYCGKAQSQLGRVAGVMNEPWSTYNIQIKHYNTKTDY